jgi:hypothetical protein
LTPCLAAVALALTSCAPTPPESVSVVDLVRELPRAEMRPAQSAFSIVDHVAAAQSRPSIQTTAPSRLMFTLPIPRRSTFRAAVALGGSAPTPTRFRIGISDDRIYEALADRTLTAADRNAWADIQADLSAYAGWKWSLFYRPERRRWRLVLSTDAIAGAPGEAIWGAPTIYADVAAAKEYVKRSGNPNPEP